MPMDDRAKATVRALLDRYPRGYAAEEAVEGTKALLARGWHSTPEMTKTTLDDRAAVLRSAGYPRPEEADARLGEATEYITEHYDGNLENLRREADGDRRRLRGLLLRIPGMDDAGYAVFVRDLARGQGEELLGWLAGALALTDAPGDYDRIREAAS